MTIIQERWEKIKTLPLKHGAHNEDSEFCVMEAAAFVAGEKWTDRPKSVPPTIAALFRCWNDSLPTDADRDRLLKPFIPRVIGLSCDKATETRRAVMAGDFVLRTVIPEWLRLVKRDDLADQLAQKPEFTTLAELEKAARADLAALADLAAHLEVAQSALVERMIECKA